MNPSELKELIDEWSEELLRNYSKHWDKQNDAAAARARKAAMKMIGYMGELRKEIQKQRVLNKADKAKKKSDDVKPDPADDKPDVKQDDVKQDDVKPDPVEPPKPAPKKKKRAAKTKASTKTKASAKTKADAKTKDSK